MDSTLAHLGKDFAAIYKHLFEQRKQYPKKSAESAMLKLALNGVYGDSNNQFSVFYDPLFYEHHAQRATVAVPAG